MVQQQTPHILHLPRWIPGPHNLQGGVFIKKQIESIQEYRQSVIYVASSTKSNIEFNKILEVSTKNVNYLYYYYTPGTSIFNLILYLYGVFKCYKRAKKLYGKPNLIHAHVLLRTYVIAWVLNKIKGIPYIISEHWSGYYFGKLKDKSALYKKLLKLSLKRASKVIVVSERLKVSLTKTLKYSKKNIDIIPNIVDAKAQQSKPQSNKMLMLSVADLKDDIKRISYIIKAFNELNINELEYHIIGDGPDRIFLEKQAGDELNNSIFFHGEKSNEEILEMLPSYHFLVAYSTFETFGIVPLEAILSGLPVISTKTGCPELIQTEDVGYFINDKENELYTAIKRMAQQYATFKLNEAQKKIKNNFSSQVVGAEISIIYKSVLNAD